MMQDDQRQSSAEKDCMSDASYTRLGWLPFRISELIGSMNPSPQIKSSEGAGEQGSSQEKEFRDLLVKE